MRRSLIVVLAALAACGGHTAPPTANTAPDARPAAAASSAALHYVAGSSRYRVEQSQHIRQEVMGQVTEVEGTTNMVVSAALTAAEAGALAAVFTVDSVTATSSAPGAVAALESLRGKMYRGVYTAQGRSTSFTNPDSANPASTGGGEVFREFLPVLPVAPVEGTSWTDTSTQTQSPAPGMSTRSQSIRQHRVVGWELHDGARALKITTTAAYTITGSGEAQGQQMSIAGSGTRTIDQFVSAAGVYVGGALADSANMTVSVTTMGIEVPVRQTRRVAVTRLP